MSHLVNLRDRLARSGIDATALTAADEPDKATMGKARRKVLDQALEDRAMTPAMRDTPSARLQRRALYGHWLGPSVFRVPANRASDVMPSAPT